MKKFLVTLLTCLACLQSSYTFGAVAPFGQSVLIMDAILSATASPEFSSLFSPYDFITRLDRKTKIVNQYGEAKYILATRTPGANNQCEKTNLYLVAVDVQPNPSIGPSIITVISIEPLHLNEKHKKKHCRDHSSSFSLRR